MLKALVTILVVSATATGYAQELSYKQFTTADGLSGNVVYRAFQDKEGYIWFCTNAGVSRFDGIHFKNYSIKDGLADNEVFNAVQTRSGKILFITFNTKSCYYDDSDGRIHNEHTDPWLREHFHGIGSLYQDHEGKFWSRSYDDPYVFMFDEENKRIHRYPAYLKDSVIIVNDQSMDTVSAREYTTAAEKITRFREAQAGVIEALPDIKAYVSLARKYTAMLGKEHPSIPISCLYDMFTRPYTPRFRFLEFNYPALSNRIWLSHGNNGIQSYDDPFDPHEKPDVYLARKNISYFFIDKEGNYWFTSNGEGVFLLTAHAVRNYRPTGNTPEVYALAGDRHRIAAGINNEVLMFNKAGIVQNTLRLNTISTGSIYNRVKDVLLDGDRLWAGSDISGIMLNLHPPGGVGSSANGVTEFTRTATKCIVKGANGRIYVGTHGNIIQFDHQRMTVLATRRITAIAEIAPGHLLLGSIDGLYTYDGGNVKNFNDHPLFKISIADIEKVKDDLVCIATSGVGMIMLKGGQFFSITAADSLPPAQRLSSDICRKFFVDAANNIWVCTNQGLSMITFTSLSPPAYTVQHFTTDDGLLSNDVNDVYVTGDTVWVATMAGLNIFRHSQVKRKGSLPLVYISNTGALNGRSFSFGTKITVGLQGISYESLGKIRYEYQLKGLNTTWQTTSRHGIDYEVLPPGNYELQVYAVNRFGQKSARPALASFTVLHPWWQTGWAYLAYCTTITSLISGTVFFAKRRSRRKEKARMKHRKQLQHLELKALRAQMNPHFIFNTLNAIQKYVLENDADQSYRYLSKFARLIRNFLENSRHTKITLQQELDLLQSYIEMEALRFRNKFAYELWIDPVLDPSTMSIPSMLIQPYVENAIWHGIQHKHGIGHVKISIHHLEPGVFRCSIEDNGIGRRRAEEIEGQAYTRHQPVGMTITRKRLKLINQGLKNRLSVNFIDLTESASGKESGTIVELLITYSSKQYDSVKGSDHRR